MRAAVVLALAPILTLGLFVAARSVVNAEPATVTTRPDSLVWGDRVFTNRGQLATWLESRDASYRVWVRRHPGASWFHRSRASALPPAATPTRSSGSQSPGRSDLGLGIVLGALGLGGVLLVIGLIRTAGAAVGRRKPRPILVPAAIERPTGRPSPGRFPARRTRSTAVYAPPRVMPALPTRDALAPAAKVVPLYVPPEPDPEPLPALTPVEPPVIEPVPAPTPLRIAPPAPEPAAEAAPIEHEAPEPAAEAAPAEHEAPVPVETTPVPVPVPAQPEPPPEPEPELPPAARREAPVERARAELPPPGALPEPAPPERVWLTCEIGLWQGYVKSQFFARVDGDDGAEYAIGLSPPFRSRDPLAHDEIGRAAHLQLAQQLLEEGWVADGRGESWYAVRFRQPA